MKVAHVGRYAKVGRLLLEHGRNAVGRSAEIEADSPELERDAEELARELEAMGPTFVKLGQLLSTRADVLPPAYLDALARLQDDVAPIPFDVVRATFEEELGVRITRAFAEFDEKPAAAGSLGQVHRAVLHSGVVVAVKVQRPGIRARAVDDMDVIQEIAAMVDEHSELGRRFAFGPMTEEFRTSLLAELDYRVEAQYLTALHDALDGYDRVVVPKPIPDYSSTRVLTMEWVSGRKLSSLGPVAFLDIDGAALAEELVRVYLDQILIHGVFHADPHPGNVLLTDDGKLALIDLGMVGHVAPELQDQLIKFLLAVAAYQGEVAADVIADIGAPCDDFDRDALRRRVQDIANRNRGRSMRDIQTGRVLAEMLQAAAESGLRPPPELTMIGKALLNLDELARILAPDLDPNVVIAEHANELLASRLRRAFAPSNVVGALLDAREFAERLPSRVNKVMDALAEGQFTLNVRGIDERELMRGVQKLANRIAAGIVIAALVVGAALIMRIKTAATLFGYPALAIVLFLIAAGGAAWLLVCIALSDLPQQRRRRAGRESSRA